MKTINTLLIAALSLTATTFLACSNDNLTIENSPTKQDNVVTLVATLSSENGAETRSVMTDNETTISTAWEVGDKIWVNYDDTGDNNRVAKGTVSAVTDGKATVTVDLVNPKDASIIVFGFPYDHWTEAKDVRIDQIGTLADINLNHAAISGSGTLTVVGSVATLPDNVSMNQEMAIWKLNFKDGGTDITNQITSLNINCGVGDDYMVTPNAQSDIYVALYPVDGGNITITAATATGNYSYSKSGVTLDYGKFYLSEVAMSAAVPSSTYRVFTTRTAYSDVAIPGGATIVGNSATDVSWAAGSYVVSNDVTIDGGVTLEGDVDLILKDGAQLTVNGIIDGATNTASLRIFGQALSTGKLIVDSDGDWVDINTEDLEIHGGIISTINADQTIETDGVLKIYHGTVTAIGPYNGFEALGDFHIYGGNITATATVKGRMGIECGGSLVIDGGYIVANGGNATADGDNGGDAISCSNITINGGTVIATGGNGYGDGNGGYGIYNLLMGNNIVVNGGYVKATGGAKGATGTDGYGIYDYVNVKSPLKMYVGDSADPSTDLGNGDDLTSTKRYVIIQ